jgi:hypothetical protein
MTYLYISLPYISVVPAFLQFSCEIRSEMTQTNQSERSNCRFVSNNFGIGARRYTGLQDCPRSAQAQHRGAPFQLQFGRMGEVLLTAAEIHL